VRPLLVICIFLIAGFKVTGQTDSVLNKKDTLSGRFYVLQKVKRDGETLPEVEIKEIKIYSGRPPASSRSDLRKYDRLVYNLKRVYPYALLVRLRLDEVNRELENINGDKERRKYIREVEKDVFGKYEDDMRQMTITQGRLLIKLIDRETQNTSYDLIRQYRGGLTAAFWQGIARIFGTNLKEKYDPWGEDALIELIINEIETGML
jgi:hypothetical protein